MSALGQKQTCAVQNVMSALPPIADMCDATRDVRFVPIADIASFDHFVGSRKDVWRYFQPKGLRNFEINHKLKRI